MRPSSSICALFGGIGIVDGSGWRRGRRLAVKVWDTVGVCGGTLSRVCVLAEGIGMPILTRKRLRLVGNYLHSAGNGASGTASTGGVGGGGRTAVALGELLNEGGRDVISSNVDSISNTCDYQSAFRGKRKCRPRGIKSCTGGVLDFTDAGSRFADNGTNEDVWDEKTEGICLRLRCGSLVELFIVKGSDDQTKSLPGLVSSESTNSRSHLGYSIDSSADCQYALTSPSLVVRHSALGLCKPPDLGYILSTLTNDGSGFRRRY